MSMFHYSIPFHFIEENGTRIEWKWNKNYNIILD